jgi:hypothetical protein
MNADGSLPLRHESEVMYGEVVLADVSFWQSSGSVGRKPLRYTGD